MVCFGSILAIDSSPNQEVKDLDTFLVRESHSKVVLKEVQAKFPSAKVHSPGPGATTT